MGRMVGESSIVSLKISMPGYLQIELSCTQKDLKENIEHIIDKMISTPKEAMQLQYPKVMKEDMI